MSHVDRQISNLAHYGEPLLPLLKQEDTLDVVANSDGKLWVNRLGRGFECEGCFSPSRTKLLLSGIATVRQIQLDHDHPILETIFPLTGDRIEGLIAPVVAEPVFAIRTRPKKIYRLTDMTKAGILDRQTRPAQCQAPSRRLSGKGDRLQPQGCDPDGKPLSAQHSPGWGHGIRKDHHGERHHRGMGGADAE